MKCQFRCHYLIAASIVFALLLSGPSAKADDVRPVQIQVKEVAPGEYDVKWSVPKLMPPGSMPSPRFPDGSEPVGERTFIDRPSAWFTQQVYRCPGGLAGRPIGVYFPRYNIGLSTLIRVEFLSGENYAHLLGPGEDSWLVPEASGGGFARRLSENRAVLAGGVSHFFGGWIYLVFLLMICLLGETRIRVRLTTAFLLGQVGAVTVGSLSAIRIDAPVAEIGVAVATVILAREALRPARERKQLAILAACAGVAHGLGIQSLPSVASLAGPAQQSGAFEQLVFVLGMDFALLTSTMVASGIVRFIRNRPLVSRLARAAVYGAAGISLALAAGAAIESTAPAAGGVERRLELPGMVPSAGTATPGSRRIATGAPNAAIQSFLAIEAFEVRHEVLVRLRDIGDRVGAGRGPELAIEYQSDVKERVRELVLAHASVSIDGKTAIPVSQRVDFITLDDKGVLPRPTPVLEVVENAWVGVTAVYLSKTTARELTLTWEFFDTIEKIPATVTDPEFSNSASVTPDNPVLRWINELEQDPVPVVSAIAVEPIRHTLPLWSIVALAAALFFAGASVRRRDTTAALALVRVLLVVAIVLSPFGNVAIALPWTANSTPGAGEVRRILGGILPNVYRALEFREESAVFDRLALSVKGETLSRVYLDHRRVLEMEERGGARARVEAVEIVDVDSIHPEHSGGFTAETVWTVGGTVTHFGHRHFRQNRNHARVTVVPDQGTWKLQAIELLDEKRLR